MGKNNIKIKDPESLVFQSNQRRKRAELIKAVEYLNL